MINIKNKNFIKYTVIGFFVLYFLLNTNISHAATIGFSPSSGYYTVGDTIRTNIVVGSNTSINAVSARVSFPRDLLTLSSISKTGSIISLWAQEPTFSNDTGTANLEGVILNGYSGASGGIVTLIFKAKGEGQAELKFLNASILANDGNGTEVYSTKGNSILTIAKGNSIPKVITPKKDEEKVETKIPIKEEIIDTSKQVVNKVIQIEQTNNLPDYSLVAVLTLVLIIFLVLIIIYGIYYVRKLKNYLKKKLFGAETNIIGKFEILEDEVNEEIAIANKIKKGESLTQEEIAFQSKLQKDIKNTEDDIVKEIKRIDIE
jgi:hypothetical protein